jgi:hypothetical protein
MRIHLRTIPSLMTVALFAMPVAHAQAVILDGKAFVADAGVQGKEADEKNDIISFTGGKFHSSGCDKYGFGKGDYRAAASGDAVSFEAETLSEKDGRLTWKGVVRGDSIEGTFVHYRKPGFFTPNPAPVEHWFKGKVKS